MFSPRMWGLATFEAESARSSLFTEVWGLPKKAKPTADLQKIHDGQHHFPGDLRVFLGLGGFVSRRVKGTISCCPVLEE